MLQTCYKINMFVTKLDKYEENKMNFNNLLIPTILAVVVVAIIATIIGLYNSLARLKTLAEAALSQIDVQLKERADLIPNLINTVKGAANFEKSTLAAVTELRAAGEKLTDATRTATADHSSQAQQAVDAAAKSFNISLRSVAEAYPQLTATSNFSRLQEQLTSMEEKIAFARQSYNDAVADYNIKIRVFPTVIIAKLFHYEPFSLYKPAENVEIPPKVEF